MSYLVFESEQKYNQWIDIINQQFGLPNEYASRYTNKIPHPTTSQIACLFKVGEMVQPPEGAYVVEEDWMYEHGWFKRNSEQTTNEQI